MYYDQARDVTTNKSPATATCSAPVYPCAYVMAWRNDVVFYVIVPCVEWGGWRWFFLWIINDVIYVIGKLEATAINNKKHINVEVF